MKKKNAYNLYERNLYKYFQRNFLTNYDNTFIRERIFFCYIFICKTLFQSIYLNYIELPITTKCTLRCKECANLIQYYENGKNYNYKEIINDVYHLSQVTKGIEILRILGGEPLLHPYLKEILKGILKNRNIHQIQIVTNGTLLFKDDIIPILKNKRISVDISNYGDISKNFDALVKQLRKNRIKFFTNKDLRWTRQSDFTFQKKANKELKEVFKSCKLDCISFFDGKVYLCPRSSNGEDLRMFDSNGDDYVDLRKGIIKEKVRKELFRLLNKKSIVACNYCSVYMQDILEPCLPGEQISKENALIKYKTIMHTNGGV